MHLRDLSGDKEAERRYGLAVSISIALLFFISASLLREGARASTPKEEDIRIVKHFCLVEMCDATRLRFPTLRMVRDEVIGIYRRADVEIVWLHCGSRSPFRVERPYEARVYIRDRLPDKLQACEGALGCALAECGLPPGPVIYISRSSIEEFIGRPKSVLPDELARALGRTIAHELAHRFLGQKEHCGNGIMKAGFSREELVQPISGIFYFTQEQIQFIQSCAPCAADLHRQSETIAPGK